jgi:hypothetical protein
MTPRSSGARSHPGGSPHPDPLPEGEGTLRFVLKTRWIRTLDNDWGTGLSPAIANGVTARWALLGAGRRPDTQGFALVVLLGSPRRPGVNAGPNTAFGGNARERA